MKRLALAPLASLALVASLACGSSSTTGAPAATQPQSATDTASSANPPAAPRKNLGPAPDFELTDVLGTKHRLSQYRGKMVVLEWFNPGCPFIKYAYGPGPMKALQKEELAKGDVVWLSINSNAPGKQGSGLEANRAAYQSMGLGHPLLIDESGRVGHLYDAHSTPNMFVIDGEGNLVYRGSLDNAPLGKVPEGGEVVNYVRAALDAVRAGTPVAEPDTPSYGCSVKYAD